MPHPRALLACLVLLALLGAVLAVLALWRTVPEAPGLGASRDGVEAQPPRGRSAELDQVSSHGVEATARTVQPTSAPLVRDPETVTVRLVVPEWTTDEQRETLRGTALTVRGMVDGEADGAQQLTVTTEGLDEDLSTSIEFPVRCARLGVAGAKVPTRGPVGPDLSGARALPKLVVGTRVTGSPGARVLEVELAPVPAWQLRFEGPDGRAPAELTAEMTDTFEPLSPWPERGVGHGLLTVHGLRYAERSLVVRAVGCEPLVVELPEAHRTGLPLSLGPFQLRASIQLAGQLVDPDGKPAADFTVRMSEAFPGMVGAIGTATTDAEGRFVLGPPSDATVVVFGLGSVRGVPHFFGPVHVGRSRSPVRATVLPAPTVTLVLTGDDPGYGNLASVSITSMDDETGGTRKTAKRVNDGKIALGGLFPGRWRVEVQRGEAKGTLVIDATEGHRDVELRLAR